MKGFSRLPSPSSHGSRWRAAGRRASGLALRGLLLGVLIGPAPATQATPIAVVVNSEVAVDELSFPELRRIMLGERMFWSSGKPIKLIVRGANTNERDLLLEKIYRMSESQFRQYWIAKVFRAEATSEPLVAKSSNEAVELTGVMAGAITMVRASDVPSGLKVVKIDGLMPDEPGYRLDSPEN